MAYNKLAPANDNQFNRNSKRVYYLPRNDLNKYNVIIDGRNFYDNPIENWKRRRLYYRILLDYDYILKHYKLVAIDLYKQKELDADPRAI